MASHVQSKLGQLGKRTVQDRPARVPRHALAPPPLQEVLHSTGRPLDEATRTNMEGCFGHDFSRVRVHADARAAESALALNSLAYTVGRDVVFGPGQYAPGTTQGRKLLAHELTHVARQGTTAAPGPAAFQVGAPDSLEEVEAAAVGGRVASGLSAGLSARTSAAGASGVLYRQPSPTGQLNLSIDENGRVDVTVAGPELPVVGNPTIGIRRNPDGTYDVLVGGKGKTVAASEIPGMLRGAMGESGGAGGSTPRRTFRVPRCDQLRSPDGTRYMTYDEYRISQMLSADLLPLTRTLFEALIEACQAPAPTPTPSPTPAPGPTPTTPAPAPTPSLPRLELEWPRVRFGTIESMTIDHFAVDGATIPASYNAELDHLARLLNLYREVDVHIDGHTDSTSSPQHNQPLSERRARAVRDALVRRRVMRPERLLVEGFGEDRRLFPDERNEEERARNRRVEVWFHTPPSEGIGERFRVRPGLMGAP